MDVSEPLHWTSKKPRSAFNQEVDIDNSHNPLQKLLLWNAEQVYIYRWFYIQIFILIPKSQYRKQWDQCKIKDIKDIHDINVRCSSGFKRGSFLNHSYFGLIWSILFQTKLKTIIEIAYFGSNWYIYPFRYNWNISDETTFSLP